MRYLKPYTGTVIAAVVLMIVEVASNVLQPKYMEQIVDDGVLQMNIDVVVHAGVMMLIVALIGGAGGFLSCVCSNVYSQRFGNDLRKSLFRKVMSLSPEQGDVITAGSLITRMTGDTKVVTEFSSVVIQTVIKPLMLFILGIVMVVSIDPVYGIVLLVSLPLQIALMVFFIKRSSAIFRIIQRMVDKLNTSAIHIVANNRLIKAYVKEDYESARFDRQNIDLTATVMKVQLFMALLNPLVMLILNAVVVAIIFIGGFQIEAGLIKIGSIMAVISYSQQILMSMMTMGGIFQYISRSKVSADRICEIMDTEPCIKSGESVLDTEVESIELKNVTFRYPRSKESVYPAIDNVSLKLSRGECVGVLGPTGAGKSTLMSLMIRAYDTDAGEVLINSKNIKDYQLPALRSRIIPVFQNSDIFPATLKENITAGCACSEEEFRKAVRVARVDEFAPALSAGYDTKIAERGNTLSGGQKQRVAIARALLRNASVLILDDSTSSLDAATEREVLDGIRREYADITLIFISQRVSCMKAADRILLMDRGGIAAEGSREDLYRSSAQYRAICDSQQPEGGDAVG
ncbi:MAG: ABC transporter ATP-binding protein [Ruminococcus sp.]|nr:ABC transporter ATP-binding protein [Ruminococcus sp.]